MGQFVRRYAEPDGIELLMVLIANQDNGLELEENADGTVPLDTCLDCATRVAFVRTPTVN